MHTDQMHEEESRESSGASLYYSGPPPSTTDRATTVDDFRMLTSRDYLRPHLHLFGLAEDDTSLICYDGTMNGDHIPTSCLDLAVLGGSTPNGPSAKSGHWLGTNK